MKIYIAALTHNDKMVANEAMPLVPGYLKCFLEKMFPGEVECRIFCYPDKLQSAVLEDSPDVLMASNYLWNEALSLSALAAAKRSAPGVVTVMGGPNFSLDSAKRERFLRANSFLDAVILGEAETACRDLVEALSRSGGAKRGLVDPSLSFLCRIAEDGGFQSGFQPPALPDLNALPSPWLSGVLDEFFDGSMAPLLETTRGCSSRCLYCVQGAGKGQKVRQFDAERIREEIGYIAKRIHKRSPGQGYLAIADPEFGVHDKDLAVADCIQEQRRLFRWPRFVDATTGNGRSGSVLRVMERLNDCLTMYNSVQTMNPAVAKTIRRRHRGVETLAKTQGAADAIGIRSLSETILALPGEGYESHKKGVFDLLRAGFKHLVNYQCMLLKGSDLESTGSRSRYGLSTMFRALPRCSGIYRGVPVIEVEEIVTSTPELPFGDYLKARRLHLVLFVFHAAGWFDPLFEYLRTKGLDAAQVLERLAERELPEAGAVADWMAGFFEETRGELFETEEACRRFYADPLQFARLKAGEIGGNLVFKYLAVAVFQIWPQVVDCVFETALSILPLPSGDEALLGDLRKFVRHRIVHGNGHDLAFGEETVEFHQDIPAWVEGGFQGRPAFAGPGRVLRYRASLREERIWSLKDARALFGADLAGITKLVARTRRSDFEKDYFRIGAE